MKKEEESKVEEIKWKYGGKKLVFFIGRHVEYKGLRYLLDAEKHIKEDCRILIAGNGPLTEQLNIIYMRQMFLLSLPLRKMKLLV